MKIRLEGTVEEINRFIPALEMGQKHTNKVFPYKIKSVSKFYPNRNTAERFLNITNKEGRVYLEIE